MRLYTYVCLNNEYDVLLFIGHGMHWLNFYIHDMFVCSFLLLGWSYKSCVVDIYVNHDDVMTWKRQLVPIKNRTHDNSYPWHFALISCTQENMYTVIAYPWQFIPKTIRNQDNSYPKQPATKRHNLYEAISMVYIHDLTIEFGYLDRDGGNIHEGTVSIKRYFSRYGIFHYNDKTVVRPSYLYNGNSYTGETITLFWDKRLVVDTGTEQTLLAACRKQEL